jgi:hypothetical protein
MIPPNIGSFDITMKKPGIPEINHGRGPDKPGPELASTTTFSVGIFPASCARINVVLNPLPFRGVKYRWNAVPVTTGILCHCTGRYVKLSSSLCKKLQQCINIYKVHGYAR